MDRSVVYRTQVTVARCPNWDAAVVAIWDTWPWAGVAEFTPSPVDGILHANICVGGRVVGRLDHIRWGRGFKYIVRENRA